LAGGGIWTALVGGLLILDSRCNAVVFSLPLVWKLQTVQSDMVAFLYIRLFACIASAVQFRTLFVTVLPGSYYISIICGIGIWVDRIWVQEKI